MNGLQEKGIPRNVVLKELKTRLGKDLTYDSVTAAHIDVFLEDLNDAVNKLKSRKDT